MKFMPFSDFYLIFLNFIKCNLSLKNCKKWGFIRRTAGLTWCAGARKADWRGTRDPRGCDEAHKATWQGRESPREAQVAHRARTRGRRPRGSTQTPVWGATWQGGWCVKGPQVSGPWWEYWGGNANALPHPNLYTRHFRFFYPCGTMFPRIFLL